MAPTEKNGAIICTNKTNALLKQMPCEWVSYRTATVAVREFKPICLLLFRIKASFDKSARTAFKMKGAT